MPKRSDVEKTIKKQPSWCDYPEADTPFWGCWSLLYGYIKDENYCKDCDCYKEQK